VAHAVAADPRRWLPTIHAATVRGDAEPGFSHLPEASLSTDLPYRSWLNLVGVPLDQCSDKDPRPLVANAMTQVLELAERGGTPPMRHRHAIGDLVLDPLFDQAMRWRYARAELGPAWRAVRDVVPDHARATCEELALWCAAAPDNPSAT
jgi:hypothetical protein